MSVRSCRCEACEPTFPICHPRSVASYNSETARESNFFFALAAHRDTLTDDSNWRWWHDASDIFSDTSSIRGHQE